MRANDFRRIALKMRDAIEGAHMNHPDFRVNGKIFATLYPDGKQGMVKLTAQQQKDFMLAHPVMFCPAAGAWGRMGCTTVRLNSIDEETLGAAMSIAWQNAVVKPAPRRAAARKKRG